MEEENLFLNLFLQKLFGDGIFIFYLFNNCRRFTKIYSRNDKSHVSYIDGRIPLFKTIFGWVVNNRSMQDKLYGVICVGSDII